MRRARCSVAGGVGGRSSIFQSGWKAVKYHGSLMDAKTIVGGIQLRIDALPV
jgi:hypothetical protein